MEEREMRKLPLILMLMLVCSNISAETDSFNIILQRAEQGDAQAQYEFGKAYLEGAWVCEDEGKAAEWFKKSAEQGYAKSQFHLGVTYLTNEYKLKLDAAIYKERDAYSKQIKEMRKDGLKWLRLAYPNVKRLAESGDPEAQLILSRMLSGMLPDIKDKDKAAEWRRTARKNLKKIAESGNIKAQRNLGETYAWDSLISPEKIKWYTKAASQGDAIAQYKLGSSYKYAKEYAKSIEWLTKASAQGHIEAQYKLGEMYDKNQWNSRDGEDIKAFHNDNMAIKWYLKAAQREHVEAQRDLAFHYCMKEDYENAVKWYTKAAEQGHIDAQKTLANMYYLGDEVEKDYEKALKWFKRIAEQPMVRKADLSSTQRTVAHIFYYIKKDYAKAFNWFKKMANRGAPDGQYKIGEMYYEGLGTEKNLMKAAMWYMKAAESGVVMAQFHLAKMYFNGEGVIQDYVEAYKWANLAAMKIERYRSFRDAVKKNMTTEQIAEGQKKAGEFYENQQK